MEEENDKDKEDKDNTNENNNRNDLNNEQNQDKNMEIEEENDNKEKKKDDKDVVIDGDKEEDNKQNLSKISIKSEIKKLIKDYRQILNNNTKINNNNDNHNNDNNNDNNSNNNNNNNNINNNNESNNINIEKFNFLGNKKGKKMEVDGDNNHINDLKNQEFQDQKFDLSEEKIKDVLVKLSNIAQDDSFAKAETIDKSKVVKKILSKYDRNKAGTRDINKLKQIFYSADGYDREDQMYNIYFNQLSEEYKKEGKNYKMVDLKKLAREMAIDSILQDERLAVMQVLKHGDSPEVTKVKQEIKEELKRNNSDRFKFNGKIIKWDTSLATDEYENSRKGEFLERRSKIIAQIKKKKQDKFLKAFSYYEKVNDNLAKVNVAIDKVNAKTNDVHFGKAKDGMKQPWSDLKNKYFADVEMALKEYLTASEIGATGRTYSNPGAFSQLGAVGVALWNRIKNLEELMHSLKQ